MAAQPGGGCAAKSEQELLVGQERFPLAAGFVSAFAESGKAGMTSPKDRV
jgi:hypothetical protein